MESWGRSGTKGRSRGSYPLLLGLSTGSAPRLAQSSGAVSRRRVFVSGHQLAIPLIVGLIALLSAVGMVAGGASATSDLSLSSAPSSGGEVIVAGEAFGYTVTVRNSGPDDATGVLVSSDLSIPEGVSISSFAVSGGEYDQKTGVWTVGSLPAGEVESLTIELSVASSVPPGGAIFYSGKVTGEGIDLNPEDDEATWQSAVTTDADVEVIVTSSSPEGELEDRYLYTVAIRNHGPSDARNVWFKDLIPAAIWLNGARYRDEATGDEGEWIGFLDLGDLAPGEARTTIVYGDPCPAALDQSSSRVTITVWWTDALDQACNSEVASCRVDILD